MQLKPRVPTPLAIGLIIWLVAGPLSHSREALAAAPTTAPAEAAAAPPEKNPYLLKPLDGVPIEAVETYVNPRSNELGAGLGFFPFNPYYNGLSLSMGYTYHFSQTFAWEILHFSYILPFDKGLTTELADRYQVNPQVIDRLQFIASTDVIYTFAYGKFVLFKDFIRYFRSSFIFGGGFVQTQQTSGIAANLGFRLQVFTSETFSWKLEVRNSTVVTAFDNSTSFTLGPALSF